MAGAVSERGRVALLSTLLLASWDEWHQSFLPGRTSTPRDVAAGLLRGAGGAVGGAVDCEPGPPAAGGRVAAA